MMNERRMNRHPYVIDRALKGEASTELLWNSDADWMPQRSSLQLTIDHYRNILALSSSYAATTGASKS